MNSVLAIAVPKSEVLTSNQRQHWAAKSKRTRLIRERARANALYERIGPFGRTHLRIVIEFPDHRRRDVHNWMPTAKACVDGFVDAGVWLDDSTDYLVGPDLRVSTAKCPPGQIRLTFTFTPIQENA